MIRRPPRFTRTDTLFPYTTLFRSICRSGAVIHHRALPSPGSPVESAGHTDRPDRPVNFRERVMAKELQHFIGGKKVAGTSGRFLDVFNPTTGEVSAKAPLASKAEEIGSASCRERVCQYV